MVDYCPLVYSIFQALAKNFEVGENDKLKKAGGNYVNCSSINLTLTNKIIYVSFMIVSRKLQQFLYETWTAYKFLFSASKVEGESVEGAKRNCEVWVSYTTESRLI